MKTTVQLMVDPGINAEFGIDHAQPSSVVVNVTDGGVEIIMENYNGSPGPVRLYLSPHGAYTVQRALHAAMVKHGMLDRIRLGREVSDQAFNKYRRKIKRSLQEN